MSSHIAQFQRDRLPDPLEYFQAQGLVFSRHGKWRSTECVFHGGSTSMRIHLERGCWVCMACNARGGDVLAYHMATHCLSFIEAAIDLGAWQDNGEPAQHIRPRPLSAIDALQVLDNESVLVTVVACNLSNGFAPTDADLARLLVATGRISHVRGMFL